MRKSRRPASARTAGWSRADQPTRTIYQAAGIGPLQKTKDGKKQPPMLLSTFCEEFTREGDNAQWLVCRKAGSDANVPLLPNKHFTRREAYLGEPRCCLEVSHSFTTPSLAELSKRHPSVLPPPPCRNRTADTHPLWALKFISVRASPSSPPSSLSISSVVRPCDVDEVYAYFKREGGSCSCDVARGSQHRFEPDRVTGYLCHPSRQRRRAVFLPSLTSLKPLYARGMLALVNQP